MFVQLVHAGLTNTLLLYTLALAGWSFVIFFRRSEITPAYWGAFAICCGMFGLQFVLGLLLALGSGTDVRWVHYLYGTLVSLRCRQHSALRAAAALFKRH